MIEEFAGNNLISLADRFLSHSVFPSPGESVKALKSYEALLRLTEELGIPQRCIDAVVASACSGEPSSSFFGWPVMDDSAVRQRNDGTQLSSWTEILTMLGLPFYKRLISAMRESEHMNSEPIELMLSAPSPHPFCLYPFPSPKFNDLSTLILCLSLCLDRRWICGLVVDLRSFLRLLQCSNRKHPSDGEGEEEEDLRIICHTTERSDLLPDCTRACKYDTEAIVEDRSVIKGKSTKLCKP